MKRLLIVICMLAVLVFLFTISASAAEIPEWSTVDLTWDTQMKATAQFGLTTDYDARIMFDDGKTYPAWYFTRITEKNGYVYLGSDSGYASSHCAIRVDIFNGVAKTTYTIENVVRYEAPSGITALSQGAFHKDAGCVNIVTIDIPEGVTYIRQYAFKARATGQVKLTKVNLPSTIETIEKDAFRNCDQLEEIYIPSGVTEIPEYAFDYCTSLTKIIGGENVVTVNERAFCQCTLTDVGRIFESVETIAAYGFKYCNVKEVFLPKIKTLGMCAFQGSGAGSAIEIIKLGNTCELLGDNVFNGLQNLHTFVACEGTKLTKSTFGGRNDVDIPIIIYTGTNASDLTAFGDANVKINNITAGVNYCVAFYDGEHNVSNPVYNFVSFIEGATITGSCSRTACGLEASKTEVAPIFSGFKYSAREDETNVFGLVMFYSVNQKSIETYKEYTGKSINYGVMAIAKKNVTNGESISNPLNADGTTAYQKIIATEIGQAVASVTMIIKGSGEAWEKEKATEFFITGYVTDGEALQYFTSSINANLSAISTISYAQYA